MRDYNGRHSFLLAWARFGRHTRPTSLLQWRAVIWDTPNISHKTHSSVMKVSCTLKESCTINENTKKDVNFCMHVDSWKLPITIAINHVLRCLNLACTLLFPSSTLPARRVPPAAVCRPRLARKTLTITYCKIIQQKVFDNGTDSLKWYEIFLNLDLLSTWNKWHV